MSRLVVAVFVGCVLQAIPNSLFADVLLGTLTKQVGTISYTVPLLSQTEPTGITFALGYDGEPIYDPADPLGSFIRDTRIGLDFSLPVSPGNNNSASRSFDVNSAGFVEVVGRLTNGVDEDIALTTIFLAADGSTASPSPSLTQFKQESVELNSASDLFNFDVSRIDLEVNSISYTFQNQGQNRRLFFGYDYEYRIYGSSAIPEPSGPSLLLLAGLGMTRLRNRRKR